MDRAEIQLCRIARTSSFGSFILKRHGHGHGYFVVNATRCGKAAGSYPAFGTSLRSKSSHVLFREARAVGKSCALRSCCG